MRPPRRKGQSPNPVRVNLSLYPRTVTYALPRKLWEKFDNEFYAYRVEPEDVLLDLSPLEKKRIEGIPKGAATIRALRVGEGMTQRELARRLEIPQPYVSAMERGTLPISTDTASKLTKIFRVSRAIFLSSEEST